MMLEAAVRSNRASGARGRGGGLRSEERAKHHWRSDLTSGKQNLLDRGPICQDAHEQENQKKEPQAAAGVGACFTPAEGSKRGRPHAHTRRSEQRAIAAGWRERSESDEGTATGEDAGGRAQRQRRERPRRTIWRAKNEPPELSSEAQRTRHEWPTHERRHDTCKKGACDRRTGRAAAVVAGRLWVSPFPRQAYDVKHRRDLGAGTFPPLKQSVQIVWQSGMGNLE